MHGGPAKSRRPALAAQSAVQNQECHRQTQELRRRDPRVQSWTRQNWQSVKADVADVHICSLEDFCVDPPDLRVGPVKIGSQ